MAQHTMQSRFIKTSERISGERVSFREVEALTREHPARRETRELVRPSQTDTPIQPITSFHTDSRYDGDLHRADMAWAVHAAARGLSREEIEYEILNSRDLSKKGPPLGRGPTRCG